MTRIAVFVAVSSAIAIAVAIDSTEPDANALGARTARSIASQSTLDTSGTREPQPASAIETPVPTDPLRISDAPAELDGLPVRAFVDRWSHAARTGDTRAAYRVYQAEAYCARTEENERLLRGPSIPREDEARASIAAWARSLRNLCDGVSPAEVDERLHFLLVAAQSGIADAQIDFFIEGPYGKPYELRAEDPDPNVIAWKARAVDFLKQAAMQNNRDALEFLSLAYFNGVVVPQDFETSLTYDIALARANHKDPDLALLATQLIKQLPESSVARARTAGEALYRQCC
ncbi:MAG: hypothetical protein ACR2GP_02780, partial [Burkholderiaceae bacterium]